MQKRVRLKIIEIGRENNCTIITSNVRQSNISSLNLLPEKHNARKDTNFKYDRKIIIELDLPPLSKIKNKIDVIVFGREYDIL